MRNCAWLWVLLSVLICYSVGGYLYFIFTGTMEGVMSWIVGIWIMSVIVLALLFWGDMNRRGHE